MENLLFRISILVIVILFSVPSCLSEEDSLAIAVGRAMLVASENFAPVEGKTSDAEVAKKIGEIYESDVTQFAKKEKARFFFCILMHIDLDASFQYEVHALMASSCGDEFFEIGSEFLEKSSSLYAEINVKRIFSAIEFLMKEKGIPSSLRK